MATLNKSKSFGTLCPPRGNANFAQGGRYFDAQGHEVPDPDKPEPADWQPEPETAAAMTTVVREVDPARLAALSAREGAIDAREKAVGERESQSNERELELEEKAAELDRREAKIARREAETAAPADTDAPPRLSAAEIEAMPSADIVKIGRAKLGKKAPKDEADLRRQLLAAYGHAA